MLNYFDLVKESDIDLNTQVCDLQLWDKSTFNQYSCCKHPDGFYIFLPPEEINVSDEYAEGDPYTVNNLESDFHQRRLTCTIDLIKAINPAQGLKVLDIGCGEGFITNEIKKTFPSFDVYGLDYAVSAIKYAHKNFTDVNFIVANAYHPPYQDHSFDIVICNNLYEHVPDPLYLLKQMGRVLKPNGVIIISTPSRYRLSNIQNIILGRGVKFMSKLHVTEYTVGQVHEQLNFGGYDVLKSYSPPIKERKLTRRLFKFMVSTTLKMVKSKHILESTVFYSAKKRQLQN
jgi:ubiquinone/menaquinone biosynthesis C-methylase UbiE